MSETIDAAIARLEMEIAQAELDNVVRRRHVEALREVKRGVRPQSPWSLADKLTRVCFCPPGTICGFVDCPHRPTYVATAGAQR